MRPSSSKPALHHQYDHFQPITIYADYAGGSLPLPLVLSPQKSATDISYPVPNPHTYPLSIFQTIRNRILHHFHVTSLTHTVVFGSGTTSCIHLLMNRFPWKKNGIWIGETCLHNSVLGTRVIVENNGGIWKVIENGEYVGEIIKEIRRDHSSNSNSSSGGGGGGTDSHGREYLNRKREKGFVVIVWSGECNVTGVRKGIKWGEDVKRNIEKEVGANGIDCIMVMDGARLVCGKDINLNNKRDGKSLDVLAFSFYKLFGLPTGLGCLIIKKESIVEQLIRQTVYHSAFAGGTVETVQIDGSGFVPKLGLVDMLEMGTQHYMGILKLDEMFDALECMGGVEQLSMKSVQVAGVCRKLLGEMKGVKVYECDHSIVLFSVWQKGVAIGWRRVVEVLRRAGIIVRGGCMCNPGVCQKLLGIGWKQGFGGCGENDVIDNRHTGFVRASFGFGSSLQDAERIAEAIQELIHMPVRSWRIKKLYRYPVKGMGGTLVQASKVTESGLLYDRWFGVVDKTTERLLTVKDAPVLAALRVSIDEKACEIKIKNRDGDKIAFKINEGFQEIWLMDDEKNRYQVNGLVNTPICHPTNEYKGDGTFFDRPIDKWLSKQLKREVKLVMKSSLNSKSFTKTRAILGINQESLNVFAKETCVENLEQRLRANIILEPVGKNNKRNEYLQLFEEDGWQGFTFQSDNGVLLKGAGRCRRCTVITVGIDGVVRKDREPLISLERLRPGIGADFGQLFDVVNCGENGELRVGDVFHPVV